VCAPGRPTSPAACGGFPEQGKACGRTHRSPRDEGFPLALLKTALCVWPRFSISFDGIHSNS
jgi:hypothetical protein